MPKDLSLSFSAVLVRNRLSSRLQCTYNGNGNKYEEGRLVWWSSFIVIICILMMSLFSLKRNKIENNTNWLRNISSLWAINRRRYCGKNNYAEIYSKRIYPRFGGLVHQINFQECKMAFHNTTTIKELDFFHIARDFRIFNSAAGIYEKWWWMRACVVKWLVDSRSEDRSRFICYLISDWCQIPERRNDKHFW